MRNREVFIRSGEQEKHPGYIGEYEKQWDTPQRMFGIVSELIGDNPNSNWNVLTELHEETLRLIKSTHSPEMVADIHRLGQESSETYPKFSRFDLDMDERTTPIYPGTLEQAVMSVECALNGADMLMNDPNVKIAISVSRPPGHHAGRNFYHGFCYLNSAAVSANAFIEKGYRVSIVDFDAHHGDGTQDIVKDIPTCKYISLHADPNQIMPHSGNEHECGRNENIFNRPFEIGISEEQYITKFEKVMMESRVSESDFIVVSAGFDAHENEYTNLPPLTHLTDGGYMKMGNLIRQVNLPTLVILEGGYNQEVTPKAFSSFIGGLTGNNNSELFTGEDTLLKGE